MTGATVSAAGKAGQVPAPAAGDAARYLRSDGTWQVPPDTSPAITTVSVTIPVSAWKSNTDAATAAAGFAYCADTAVAGLAASDLVDAVLDCASLRAAYACGMANTCTVLAGAVRFYAATVPTAAMTAQVTATRPIT